MWTPSQRAIFEASSRDMKRCYLLGGKIGPRDNDLALRKRRDLLTKTYLEEINIYRMQTKGLADLRDAFQQVTESSIEEAIAWEADMRRLQHGSPDADEESEPEVNHERL